MELRPKYNFVC